MNERYERALEDQQYRQILEGLRVQLRLLEDGGRTETGEERSVLLLIFIE